MTAPLDQILTSIGEASLVPQPSGRLTFTVIVRTRGNRPNSLNEALASLAAQTYTDFEVALMVHHPDPATLVRVESALSDDSRPAQLRLIPVVDGGRSRPLNAGIEAADTDYICFLDDDDLVMPEWLAAFNRAASTAPGSIIRAVTLSQPWTTSGGVEPAAATGPVERPYADSFDLLSHFSHNETPICSVALPRRALDQFAIRFEESLPVFEDWDLIMRLAPLTGVTSIPDETSLYRRLDSANADTDESEARWEQAHAEVLDRLSRQPVLLPAGDARRLASAHFDPGGGSRHDRELVASRLELAAITRSPIRWIGSFCRAALTAARHRLEARKR